MKRAGFLLGALLTLVLVFGVVWAQSPAPQRDSPARAPAAPQATAPGAASPRSSPPQATAPDVRAPQAATPRAERGTADQDEDGPSAFVRTPRSEHGRVLGVPIAVALAIAGAILILAALIGLSVPRPPRGARARGNGTYGRGARGDGRPR